VRNDLDLSFSNLADGDGIAKVAGAAVNLDAVVEELLEGGDIKDLVVHGLGSIDGELRKEPCQICCTPMILSGG
jgi:hypothetical protein